MEPAILALDIGAATAVAAVRRAGVVRSASIGSFVTTDDRGRHVAGPSVDEIEASAAGRLLRDPMHRLGRPPWGTGAVAALVAASAASVDWDGGRVVVAVPPELGPDRAHVLATVTSDLGMGTVSLVPAPVAAARSILGPEEREGLLLVCDLGAGSADLTLLAGGAVPQVLVSTSDVRLAGDALDVRLLRLVGDRLGEEQPDLWGRLRGAPDSRWREARARLLVRLRHAREALSTEPRVTIHAEPFDDWVDLTRTELDRLVADDLDRTFDDAVAMVGRYLGAGPLARVVLIGGLAAMPSVRAAVDARFHPGRVRCEPAPGITVALGASAPDPDPVVGTP